MAFNRETSQRQSKLTKQLNIQMIKKGGGPLQTFYLRSRHFQEQFIVYWLETVAFQLRKLCYIADEMLARIARANIALNIQEGERWYLAKSVVWVTP